jgi:hypothetical protein
MPAGNTVCTEICALAVCDNIVTGARNEQFLGSANVQKTRVNTEENDGRPEWIRTIDLFRVKEAL